MYFCPKCNSLLNITKTITNPMNLKINSLEELIKIVENNNLYGVIELNFVDKDLKNNKILKKLDDEIINKILNIYNQLKVYKNIPTYFICNHCNYHKPIIAGTIMYEKSLSDRYRNNNDLLIESLVNDKTLPRTKDFICPNIECFYNKNINIDVNKEAIFFRPFNDNYDTHYICLKCKTEWKS